MFLRTKILSGKPVADSIYREIKSRIKKLRKTPKLGIILIGDNPASLVYIKQKMIACENLGFQYELIKRPAKLSTAGVIKILKKLNQDKTISGIIVQMPLPSQVDKTKVLEAIDPKKDVDGLTPLNLGKTYLGVEFEALTPCTATGVIKLLEYYKIPYIGKKVCVVGSGNIAGKPTALMLSNRKATVTICNSKTKKLSEETKKADILIVAVGKKGLIKASMVKRGAKVIDIGITKLEGKKIVGDAEFEKLQGVVSAITPVPGGVGVLTVACLMLNLTKALE